jgi:hypothetical protein
LSVNTRHVQLVNEVEVTLGFGATAVLVASFALVSLLAFSTPLAPPAFFTFSAWWPLTVSIAAVTALLPFLLHD